MCVSKGLTESKLEEMCHLLWPVYDYNEVGAAMASTLNQIESLQLAFVAHCPVGDKSSLLQGVVFGGGGVFDFCDGCRKRILLEVSPNRAFFSFALVPTRRARTSWWFSSMDSKVSRLAWETS